MWENNWTKLITEFMTSHLGKQTAIHILLIISSKTNQTMKFGQQIEYNKIMQELRHRETNSRLLLSKALYEIKANGQHLSFDIFWKSSTWTCSKNKLYKTLNCCSRYMLRHNFLKKVLGLVSPPCFVYDFSRKMYLMLYSVNWLNFIIWLPLLHEILGNIYILMVPQFVTS